MSDRRRFSVPPAWRKWGRKHVAEIALSLVLLMGWASLTWGVAALLVWQVWPISFGLLALSACGWKFLAELALSGLYTLTREEKDA